MDEKKIPKAPSLAYTLSPHFGKPPKIHNPYLQSLGAPHVESFNYLLDEGLNAAIEDLIPPEFEFPSGERFKVQIEEASFSKPTIPMDIIGITNNKVMPTECRQRASTYKGEFKIRIKYTINDRTITVDRNLGSIPVMVRSKLCHLAGLSPKDLVEANEHADEWGGYFVVKGHERLARMLLVTRRNFPVGIRRGGWRTRGNLFSDVGVLMRCVQSDQSSTNNVLHFLTNGTAKLMFGYRKFMYYAPLILIMKCLDACPDHHLYKLLLSGHKDDLYFSNCVQNMLRELHEENLHTRAECRDYLGRMFRAKVELPPSATNEDVASFLLKRSVLPHLDRDEDKVHSLVYMAQKLYSLVQEKSKPEGADAVMVQELLLGGHLYLQILKERLQTMLYMIRSVLTKHYNTRRKIIDSEKDFQQILRKCGTLEQRMETFISTGNAPGNGVTLPQYKGLTIVAENINRMRFMSHFKAIHRGAFFTEMRTTEARQLLPDAWGFVCPVHTPDGSPCGLLNHLTQAAQVTQKPPADLVEKLPLVLEKYGMEPITIITNEPLPTSLYYYPVFIDGRLAGYLAERQAERTITALRLLKGGEIPADTEIVLIPRKQVKSQYPGVFLITSEARMVRPVINLHSGQLELIGTLEQLYLDIAVAPNEIIKGVTTHLELSKSAFMSNLAQLVPMPDCNQSPRNMYQCQMGKQTMGTPIHTWKTNAETKLYRLQTPATPLFRPTHYDNIGLDDYAMGTNAIVAVISYTGYDMEDAMIINRSSHQRGFAAGSIYKSEVIELELDCYFSRDPKNEHLHLFLDEDGLPPVGAIINGDDPLYCYYDGDKNDYVTHKYKGKERVFVDTVRQAGDVSERAKRKAIIMMRVQRNPSVGDKFASRAGQKGICSQLWPAEDLPFSESGIIPDILFNPHGFPSRMTIAMMIECMAGKSGSLHGLVHDATPFRFNEKDTAIHYFGRLLEAGGYNYFGTERMYSGADGREITADIFTGVIHYQRLRHMVSDKWQVRTTGPMDALTRQPVKGRRRGGGVRLGEMERDALLSHGASFLLHDRLFHCSDKSQALICTSCGTLLGPVGGGDACRLCPGSQALATISVPYIFKFFVTQLAAVNINVKINVSDATQLAIGA